MKDLFGNQQNNDLDEVNRRLLSWETRIDSTKDVQQMIKPYELLKGQVSCPEPLEVQKITKV